MFLKTVSKNNIKLLDEISKEQDLQTLSTRIQNIASTFDRLSGRQLALLYFINKNYLKVLRMHVKILKRLDKYFNFDSSISKNFTEEGFQDQDFKVHKMFEKLNRGYLRETSMEMNWKITEFLAKKKDKDFDQIFYKNNIETTEDLFPLIKQQANNLKNYHH